MRPVHQVLLYLLWLAEAQAAALRGAQQEVLQLQVLRQRVCELGSAEDAHQDSHAALCLQDLWQGLLQTLAAARPHQDAHWRETFFLPSLQQGLRRQIQSQGTPTDPLGCEKIPMQELLQNLLQDVSSAQA